jgi:hypothetical protein
MPIVRSLRLYREYQHVAHDTLFKAGHWSGVGLQAVRPGWGMYLELHPSSQMHSLQPHTRPATSSCYIRHPGRTACSPTPDQRSALNKVICATCWYSLYSLELLMMGIIVPKTRWANYKFDKPLCSIWSASSFYILLTMHGQSLITFTDVVIWTNVKFINIVLMSHISSFM